MTTTPRSVQDTTLAARDWLHLTRPVPPYQLTEPAVWPFVAIPLALWLSLVWATRIAWQRAGAEPSAARRSAALIGVAAAAWMALTWAAAAAGILQDWDRRPPPFFFVIFGMTAIAVSMAYSRLGTHVARHLSLGTLVAIQGFRLPLELAMHALAERGIMPVQMSYSGLNFDIVTGATAILVAVLVWTGRGGRRLVLAWNLLGLALLVNVVTVAILSMPTIRYFGDDQLAVFVTHTPFVWLPAIMVLAALAGHLVIARAVGQTRSGR
jgi:hypothetical protein